MQTNKQNKMFDSNYKSQQQNYAIIFQSFVFCYFILIFNLFFFFGFQLK